MQCCGTIMICCGSGSYLRKVLVPAPVPVPDPDYLAQFSTTKISILPLLDQHCFPESWPLIFYFLTFALHFMMDPGSNPALEPDPEYMIQFRFSYGKKLRFLFYNTGCKALENKKNRNPRLYFGS